MATLSFSNVIDEIKSGNDQQEGRLHKIEEHTRNARRHLLELKSPLLKMLSNMTEMRVEINLPGYTMDDDLGDKESEREMVHLIEKISDNIQKLVDGNAIIAAPAAEDKKTEALKFGPVALLAAGLAGIGAGLIGAYIKTLKAMFAPITVHFDDLKAKTLAKISESFKSIKASVSTKASALFKAILKPIISTFDKIRDGFKLAHLAGTEKMGGMFKPIAAIFTRIGAMFKPIAMIFAPITELFAFVKTGATNAIGKLFAPVTKMFKTFKALFAPITKAFGMVSGVVSKIFAPLFVILTIWDTVKGAMAGYEENGIVGAIGGAVKGLINSLITVPLDMLKDGVAWILRKFGFDENASALSSFSFTDEFNKIVDKLMANVTNMFNYVKGIFTGETDFSTLLTDVTKLITDITLAPYRLMKDIVASVLSVFGFDKAATAVDDFNLENSINSVFDAMKNMVMSAIDFIIDAFDFSKTGEIIKTKFASMKNVASDILKTLIAGILPKRAEGDGMMSWLTNQIVDKAIPPGIYEWAGIDQSGAKLPPPIEVAKPNIGAGVDSGFRLALAQGENSQIKEARTSARSAIVSNSTNQQNSVVNNNSIVSKIMPVAGKVDKTAKRAVFNKRGPTN